MGLKGYTLFDGKLYKTDTAGTSGSDLYRLFHNSGFYDKNANNDFSGANSIIRYDWSGEPEGSLQYDPSKWMSPWMSGFDSNKFRFRNLTNNISSEYLKSNPGFLSPGEQLIEYWDGSTARDMFGRPILDKTKNYAIINSDGELVRMADLNGVNIDPTRPVANTSLPEIIYDPKNAQYNKMYQKTIYDKQGRKLATVWYDADPNRANNRRMYLNMELWKPGGESIGGKSYDQLENGTKNFMLPTELANYIYAHPKFLNDLLNDRNLSENFTVSLSNMVNSALGEVIGKPRGRLNIEELDKLTGNYQEAVDLFNLIEALGNNSTYKGELDEKYFPDPENLPGGHDQESRKRYWFIDPYQQPQVEVKQAGGAIKKAGEIQGTPQEVKTNKRSDIGDRPRMGNFKKLSASDYASLSSAAMDIGAIIASMSGAASWTAPIIGAASSLTQFGADWAKDGLDAGDWGSLLANLGLDAVSFIPFAGAGSSAAKVAKTFHKLQNVLTPVMLAYGGKEMLGSMYRVIDGSSVGLTAALGLGRNIQHMRKTKYVDPGKTKRPTGINDVIDNKKKQAVDEWLKAHPENVKDTNGFDNNWWKNGKVADYDKAYNGLLHVDEFAKNNKNLSSKTSARLEAAGNAVKNVSDGIFSSKYNPFSGRYKYDFNNRVPLDAEPTIVPSNKTGGKIQKAAGGAALGDDFSDNDKKGLTNNDISNLIDMLKAVNEYAANNKAYRNQKRAIDKAEGYIGNLQTAQVPRAILDLVNIERSADEQKRIIDQNKVATNSAELAAAQNLMRNEQKRQVEEKANTLKSDVISKTNEYNRKVDAQNQANRVQLNNQKMQALQKIAMMNAQNQTARDLANANLFNKIGVGAQVKLEKDELQRQQYNQTAAAYRAMAGRDKEVFQKYGDTWSKMSAEDRAKYHNDINEFVQTTHGDDYASISSKWMLQRQRESMPEQNTRLSFYNLPDVDMFVQPESQKPIITTHRFGIGNPNYKKGGQIRPMHEQLFLDNNKNTSNAIQKLNDDVVKLLLSIKK